VTLTLLNAFDRVASLKATLQQCRTYDRFEQLLQEAKDACTSLDIDIPQQLQKETWKSFEVSTAILCLILRLHLLLTMTAETFVASIRSSIRLYFTTLDTVIQDIENRFNTQATETVRQMSAFCVWNDRTSNDTDNIRHLAKTYTHSIAICVQFSMSYSATTRQSRM